MQGGMKRFIVAAIATSIFVADAGCAVRPARQGKPVPTIQPRALRVDDVLRIAVAHEPGLSGRYRIAFDGTIDYPLVGRIATAGLTVSGVERVLAAKLRGGSYLPGARVRVELEAEQPSPVLRAPQLVRPTDLRPRSLSLVH
jgi:polysaccharide biosynthesis/export protein